MLWSRETENVRKNAEYRLCGLCKNVKRERCEADFRPQLRPAFRHTSSGLGYIGKHALDKIVMHSYPSLEKKKLYNREKLRAAQQGGACALRQAKTEYLLQGKARCGMCGAPVRGECKKGKGGACLNCACKSKGRTQLCKKQNDKKDFIEWYVVEQVISHILTPAWIKFLAAAMADADEKELAFHAASTREQHANAAETSDKALRIKEIAAWLKHFCEGNLMDAEFRRRVIDVFVDQVYLYDDRVVIFCSLRKDKPILHMPTCDTRSEREAEDAPPLTNGSFLYDSRITPNERQKHALLVSGLRLRLFALQLSYAA